MVGQIHDRMPAILNPESYDLWLSLEPDPHDLLITYASEPMTIWPITAQPCLRCLQAGLSLPLCVSGIMRSLVLESADSRSAL
jgi:hypothetical protein